MRALVIDDDPHIRELLRTILESEGFAVTVLRDGIDALELESAYDVILLDMRMPVFDGERLTDYWQMTRPELLRRVIVLSGYSRYAPHKLPSSVFATIEKPFDINELIRVVRACARVQNPDDRPESERELSS